MEGSLKDLGKAASRGPSLRRIFMTGFFVTIPIALTIWILVRLFLFIDGFLGRVIYGLINQKVPGLGFLATVALILLMGVITTNVFGKRLISVWERVITNIPVVKNIYGIIKGVVTGTRFYERQGFLKTVLIEYPRKGIYTVGFVTHGPHQEIHPKPGERKLVNIFIPTTPNPTSGFFLIFPEEDVIPLPIKVEEAIKLVISGGVIIPPEIQRK
jgi:uncharacterized membrane protein